MKYDWLDEIPIWMRSCDKCYKEYEVVKEESTKDFGVLKPVCNCVPGIRFCVG